MTTIALQIERKMTAILHAGDFGETLKTTDEIGVVAEVIEGDGEFDLFWGKHPCATLSNILFDIADFRNSESYGYSGPDGETTWTFEDGSLLIEQADGEWDIDENGIVGPNDRTPTDYEYRCYRDVGAV